MNRSGLRQAAATTCAAMALFAVSTTSASALETSLDMTVLPLSADLTYRCLMPLVGLDVVQVKLTSDAALVRMGTPLQLGLNAELEFGYNVHYAFRLVRASSIQGTVDVQLDIRADDSVTTTSVPLALTQGVVTGEGIPFVVSASGATEATEFFAEEVSLSVGRTLRLNLGGLNADESPSPRPLDQFTADCTLEDPETEVLTVNPEQVDFGTLVSGSHREKAIYIRNGTLNAAHISAMTVVGEDAHAFMVRSSDVANCTRLAPSQGCGVYITYIASTEGTSSAVLNIESSLGVTEVPVTGTSVIDVVPEFVVTPQALDFGRIDPHETVSREFTITNMGPGYSNFLVAFNPEGEPAFEVQGGGCASLDVGESCTYSVVFRPDGREGVSRGALNIMPLHPAATPISVSLVAESRLRLCLPVVQQLQVAGEANLPNTLKPTPLAGVLEMDHFCGGRPITASLKFDPTTARLPVLPLLFPKAGADVQLQFEPVGGLGIDSTDEGIAMQAQYHVAIPKVSVRVLGFDLVLGGGKQCRTVEPVRLDLSGDSFVSGEFVGGFNIGNLENCGSITRLLNRYLTGVDVPVTLQRVPSSM